MLSQREATIPSNPFCYFLLRESIFILPAVIESAPAIV
jgi:hypothetical protein